MTAPARGADLYDPASFDCPVCGATPGEPCKSGSAGWAGEYRVHDARYEEAAAWRDLIQQEQADGSDDTEPEPEEGDL